jgi:hypothetical protein
MKNELNTCFQQKFATCSYGVGIGRAWCSRKACEICSSLVQKKKLIFLNFSSHKLPKQQSTSFWSQGILEVKVDVPCTICFFTYQSIKECFTSLVGLKGNRIYNRQSLQLRNNGLTFRGVGERQSLQNVIVIICTMYNFYVVRPFLTEVVFPLNLQVIIMPHTDLHIPRNEFMTEGETRGEMLGLVKKYYKNWYEIL